MLDLTNLNEEQKKAVSTTEGYVRVIASPGSGKTRALTHRFAYLIEDLCVEPDRILCITYTNKAAFEMKTRIIKLLNNNEEMSFNNISTIHSYCDSFLRRYLGNNHPIKSNFEIYDEFDSDKILKIIKKKYDYLNDYKDKKIFEEISKIKSQDTSYIEYLFGIKKDFTTNVEWVDDILKFLISHNGLMFDDLIYGTLYILNHSEKIRHIEQEKYRYILVDEFQDTTPNTYELMKILSLKHKNLFVVGDPDQSIYEFIGANPNILLNQFVKDFPNTKTLLMNMNYRSTNQIIDLSNTLIKYNSKRYEQKETISFDKHDGNNVVYSHFEDKNEQYYYVCKIINYLHNVLNYKYSDIFLITRNNYSFADIRNNLTKNGIPFTFTKSTEKLNTKEEIKLILYYLTFAISENAFSLYNINSIVNLGIPTKEMEEVLDVNINPIEFLKTYNTDKINSFLESNERIKKIILSNNKKVSEIIELIIGEHNILARYKPKIEDFGIKFYEGERISRLIQDIINIEKFNDKYTIYDFIDSMALDSNLDSNSSNDQVHLLTAHGSKGLEAKNVIIFDYDTIPYSSHELESERRLSYVAFTRAKENLFILSAKYESKFAPDFKDMCIGCEKYFQNMKLIVENFNMGEIIQDLNEEKKEAFKLLCSGKNVFLTGEAGTGKTYLINKYLHYLGKIGKNALICAPTGLAASNYNNGCTINKLFKIEIIPSIVSLNKQPKYVGLDKSDVLIIDEISMCRIDVFEYVMKCVDAYNKTRKTPMQVILCGDFFQLPPVILDSERDILKKMFPAFKEGFAFESKEWESHNFINVCLKEVFRQENGEFITALNNARRGINLSKTIKFINDNCQKEPLESAMEVHSRNSVVNRINDNSLKELYTKEYIYKAEIEDVISQDVNVEKILRLKPGCRVMLLINEANLSYTNGSFATVLTCGANYIDVALDKDGSVHRVYERIFDYVDKPSLSKNGYIIQNVIGSIKQIPVKLAYAITIHKSQGQTYERVNLDPAGWENGQVYVALSRVKSIEGLYLYSSLDEESFKVSNEVIKFYEKL